MSHNEKASAFISRISNLPSGPISLEAALQPSLEDEVLRELFSTDESHPRASHTRISLMSMSLPRLFLTDRRRCMPPVHDTVQEGNAATSAAAAAPATHHARGPPRENSIG